MSTQSHSSLLGSEIFEFAGQSVGFSVIDFWRFQFSNIWDIQDQIAEFIVAKALGQSHSCPAFPEGIPSLVIANSQGQVARQNTDLGYSGILH